MIKFEYRVRLGDTLSSIARRHGTTVEELIRVNDLMSANFLWVGQSIKIEGASASILAPKSMSPLSEAQGMVEGRKSKASTALTTQPPWKGPRTRSSTIAVKSMEGDTSLKDFAETFLSSWEYALPHGSRGELTTRSVRALSAFGSLGARTPKGTAVLPSFNNGVSNDGLLTQLKQSVEVLSFGRIQPDEGAYVYDVPDTKNSRKDLYGRNTRVFVCRKLDGSWYFVRLDDGKFGYVNSERVWINPPEPDAYLYKIKRTQGALDIAKQEFLGQATAQKGLKPIHWGMDWRHYNQGSGLCQPWPPKWLRPSWHLLCHQDAKMG